MPSASRRAASIFERKEEGNDPITFSISSRGMVTRVWQSTTLSVRRPADRPAGLERATDGYVMQVL